METLKPFKAYFKYNFSGNIKELFDDHDKLSTYLRRASDDNGDVDTENFLKTYLIASNLPHQKTDKIIFDMSTPKSIYPENFSINDERIILEFEVVSKEIEVLQIDEDDITFSNSNNEVRSGALSDKIRLIKS